MIAAAGLAGALDALIRKYRQVPFSSWAAIYPDIGQLVDQANVDPTHDEWWQAQTDVLEVVHEPDGRKHARVVIAVHSQGAHSFGPPPAAELAVYEDGRVEGAWANGDRFEFLQLHSGAV